MCKRTCVCAYVRASLRAHKHAHTRTYTCAQAHTRTQIDKLAELHLKNSKSAKKPSCPILGTTRATAWCNAVHNPPPRIFRSLCLIAPTAHTKVSSCSDYTAVTVRSRDCRAEQRHAMPGRFLSSAVTRRMLKGN